jgi:hypothetical protein
VTITAAQHITDMDTVVMTAQHTRRAMDKPPSRGRARSALWACGLPVAVYLAVRKTPCRPRSWANFRLL